MTNFNHRDGHVVHRPDDRGRLLALAALSMAAGAGLLIGACSGAAPGPAASALPGKPELLQTFGQTGTGIEVSWSPPKSDAVITGYDVRWHATEGSWYTASDLPGDSTSYAIANLATDLEYLVQVRASSSAGSGDWSDPLVYNPNQNALFRAVSAADVATDAGTAGSPIRAEGTDGDDHIYVEWGSEYYDHDYVIHGLGGDDLIWTGDGNDHLYGGAGDDSLTGGPGNDTLEGGLGDDYLYGGADDDFLYGGEGSDLLYGSNGADALFGEEGDDRLVATGNDMLVGGAGIDHFVFDLGQDPNTITDFTIGDDRIDLGRIRMIRGYNELSIEADSNAAVIDLTTYGAGKIRIERVSSANLRAGRFLVFLVPLWRIGDEGNNTLIGDHFRPNNIDGLGGDDTIRGGPDDDFIVGGPGDDTLTGGCGTDRFIFAAGHGNDTVTDFGDGYYIGQDNLAPAPAPPPDGICSPTENYRPRDILDLTQLPAISGYDDLEITAEDSTVVVDLTAHGGGTIRLEQFTLEDLRSASIDYYEPPPTAKSR